MKALIQTGSSGRVPVPPEKRFLINNAYTELTDAATQRQRFMECAAARQSLGRELYPLDEPFLAALERGLPPCGGIALGFDRLVMLLCGALAIDEVRLFCEPT